MCLSCRRTSGISKPRAFTLWGHQSNAGVKRANSDTHSYTQWNRLKWKSKLAFSGHFMHLSLEEFFTAWRLFFYETYCSQSCFIEVSHFSQMLLLKFCRRNDIEWEMFWVHIEISEIWLHFGNLDNLRRDGFIFETRETIKVFSHEKNDK